MAYSANTPATEQPTASARNVRSQSAESTAPAPDTRPPGGEGIVRANGTDLCVETFGDRDDPPVLLIHSAGNSMLSWEDEFCERLAARSRFVIRYDHRGTGRSTGCEPGELGEPGAPEHTFLDLVADAAGLLDTFDLRRAHVVGSSTGGMLGQLLALDHPDRVASLTLLSSRSVGPGPVDPDLADHTDELMAGLAGVAEPDWADRASVVDFIVAGERLFAAGSQPFDEKSARDIAARTVDRTTDIRSAMNYHYGIYGHDRWRERLGEITAPTLVIHGTEDPLFPYSNGQALAAEIPGARLIALVQTGHELPRRIWDVVIPAIARHTTDKQ